MIDSGLWLFDVAIVFLAIPGITLSNKETAELEKRLDRSICQRWRDVSVKQETVF